MLRQKGFSLLEVMIAGGLLAGLGLAGAKLMSDQSKQQKGVESKAEINTILQDFRAILAEEHSCKLNFAGQDLDSPSPVTQIRQQAFYDPASPPSPIPPIVTRYIANPSTTSSTVYGVAAVRILDMTISTADNSQIGVGMSTFGPVPGSPGNKSGSVGLEVTYYMSKPRTQGQDKIKKFVKLNVEVDSNNVILRCSALGSSGVDGRYIQRNSPDPTLRTMERDLIIADGASINMNSDRSLKHNIRPLGDSVVSIRSLKPVKYKWNSSGQEVHGLIAQDVQMIFPELVKEEGGILSIDYIQLTPILLRSIQQVDEENRKLKKDMRSMKRELCLKDPGLSFCQER